MPDLQSELSKLANAWDTHEQAIRTPNKQQEKEMQTFTVTGNATRDTFNYIQQAPCKYTHTSAAKAMAQLGYKQTSVHAILTQMKRSGMLQLNADGYLFTTVDEYRPLHNPYKTDPAGKATKKKPAQATAGIAALRAPEEQPARRQLLLRTTADEVLSKLDVKEAFKLYQELAKMFGGR